MSEHRSGAPIAKISMAEKFAAIDDQWNPRIVGELNGQQVKLVKFMGPFVWHHHQHEDELFLVHRGSFRMEFRDRSIDLSPGDMVRTSSRACSGVSTMGTRRVWMPRSRYCCSSLRRRSTPETW